MKKKRFLPLFTTQFLGALNDNLFKTSLVVLVAYGILDVGEWRPEILVSLAAGLFILPFILFAPLAGDLADKYPKHKIIRIIKLAEIGIVICAIIGLAMQSVPFLLFVLFAFGTQSAFFSPSKFSILPQHLKEDELIGGNALLNTGAFLAILLGTILGGVLALINIGMIITALLLLLCSISGYMASRKIPEAKPYAPDLKLSFNTPCEAIKILRYAYQQPKGIFLAILGIAWFCFIGGTFLSQFPNYTKQTLGVDNITMTFFMVVFSMGIALGGLLNNRILHSRVEATFVPLAALGMAIFSMDLYFASGAYSTSLPSASSDLLSVKIFLSNPHAWRIVFDLFAVSLMGGLYVVPLKSIVQHRTNDKYRARVLAGGMLLEAIFILASSLIGTLVLALGFEVKHLFLILSIAGVGVAFYICQLLPDQLFKTILQILLKLFYRVEVRGLENFDKAYKEGYITILGHYRRFTKIAGEMVLLTVSESIAAGAYPDAEHAVIAVPDARKGKQLILLTTQKEAKKEELSAYASANRINEINVPKTIVKLDKMPILGSGKIDYPAVQKIIEGKNG